MSKVGPRRRSDGAYPGGVSEEEAQRLRVRDAPVMRALAHPARIAILEHLFAGHQATATELVEVSGLSPSATSYHLRALAKVDLIEEAPSRGDGRERLWQSQVRGLDFVAGPTGTATEQAAEAELTSMLVDQEEARTREWLNRRNTEAPEWYEAAVFSSLRIVVTSEELKAIGEKIAELARPSAPS